MADPAPLGLAAFALTTAMLSGVNASVMHSGAAGTGWTDAGGRLGLATAIVAGYTSFAGMLNSTFGKTILPTFPVPASPPSAPR